MRYEVWWTVFCHFGPLFTQTEFFVIYDHFSPFFPITTHKWQSYNVWFLRYEVWWTVFCHFGPFFTLTSPPPCPSTPPHPTPPPSTNKTKNQNFEKMKKTTGDIINLHKCTKNHDHMLDCSWHTTRDRCHSFILGYFLPFYPPPPNNSKNPNF